MNRLAGSRGLEEGRAAQPGILVRGGGPLIAVRDAPAGEEVREDGGEEGGDQAGGEREESDEDGIVLIRGRGIGGEDGEKVRRRMGKDRRGDAGEGVFQILRFHGMLLADYFLI